MPDIQVLSPHVADLIAAGEVVERPASVVKELTENAVDAGAHSVTVEIRNGGMTMIRVTDDGKGIAPDEAETAFLRHATSKIRTEYDLEAIGTLGFRGEALAAIAAVSRLECLTRRQEDDLGVSVTLEGGLPIGREEAGCPVGTTMLVRDLFYNTPARLKFMKKDAAEGAACLAALQRQALAHPEVSFQFIRDGKRELLTPGDGQLRSALYTVLGRDLALGFTPAEGSGEGMSVSGFITLPACCRGTRGYQFFFVNGRYVKSQTMTAALEQAYANQKMVGKFPGCALHLTIRPNAVDVNVHPTKQEVKFGSERQVFSAVHYAALSALGADHTRPPLTLGVADRPAIRAEASQTSLPLHDFTAPQTAPSGTFTPPVPAVSVRPGGFSPPPFASQAPDTGRAAVPPPQPTPPVEPRTIPSVAETEKPIPLPEKKKTSEPSPFQEKREQETEPLPTAEEQELPWHIAGELFRTYILVEQGDKVLLIDKHAAHERMNFDRMTAEDYVPMSQILLTPVVFTPDPREAQVLLEHTGELERAGFEVGDFGGGSLVVRRVPDYVEAGDVEATLTEMAGNLERMGDTGARGRREAILHMAACKAAIKGGWKSGVEELEKIARAVVSGEVKYCPHGRPVAIELTKTQLEKQFKRRA